MILRVSDCVSGPCSGLIWGLEPQQESQSQEGSFDVVSIQI